MMARSGLLLLAMGAGVASPSAGGAPQPQPRTAAAVEDIEEEILAILDDYQDALRSFIEATRKEMTDEERGELFRTGQPQELEYAARLWKVVDRQPGHPACAEALAWIYQRTGDPQGRAEKLLLEHHVSSEHIGVVCFAYMNRPAGARPVLERILAKATTPEVKGLAKMALGQHLLEMATQAETAQASDEQALSILSERYGEDALIEWMDSDPELLRAEGVALLEEVVAKYADVPHPYGGTLGASAGGFLFEMRHLQVGMVAPDIEGEDIAGVAFKLSDYRGKVVVLDFWGHW